MTTRSKAKTLELETKLRVALEELKCSKHLCDQLLHERDDSEKEIKNILFKNAELKRELSELHNHFTDVLDQRDQLTKQIESYSQCRDIFEQALERVSHLERELSEVNDFVAQKETEEKEERARQDANTTQSLYCELIGSGSSGLSHSSSSQPMPMPPCQKECSKIRKLKKYIKLDKFVSRLKKVVKPLIVCSTRNLKLRQQRSCLTDELELYKIKLDSQIIRYEVDTSTLQAEITSLEQSVNDITCKYVQAQRQISDQIQDASALLELCTYNQQRFDSLVNNHMCDCTHSTNTERPETRTQPPPICPDLSDNCCEPHSVQKSNPKTLIYSDNIGKGLGTLINHKISHNVTNYCMPDCSLAHVLDRILSGEHDNNTSIIIYVQNCLDVQMKELDESFDLLSKTGVKKIIFCSIPYSSPQWESQNDFIYSLNNYIFKLTCRHSDVFSFLDTNKVISGKILTKDTLYLRKSIARLLARQIRLLYVSNGLRNKTMDVLSSSTPPAPLDGTACSMLSNNGCNESSREHPASVPDGNCSDSGIISKATNSVPIYPDLN